MPGGGQRPLIAHILHRFDTGGLENGVVNLLNRLPAHQFRHAILAIDKVVPAFAARLQRDDIQLFALNKPPGHALKLYPRIWRLLRQLNEKNKWGINIILAKDINENFLTVETGRAVAAMQDDVILYGNIARARNPADWDVVGIPQQKEAYACMLRKGDEAFKKLVDGVIVGMMKSGDFEKLYGKYFLSPIAVKGGVTINFPMPPDVRELISSPNDRAL